MGIKALLFFLLIPQWSSAQWFVEVRLGVQLGTQTEAKKNFLYGAQIGLLGGHRWKDFTAGMEFRYLNQHIKASENESGDMLHTFPIGFAFRYDLPQLKIRPEFAYYYDCASYRDLSIIPITYGTAYGGYGSWRAGASYLAASDQTLAVFYEKQVYKQYKVRRPRVTTGDTIPHKVWDFWSLNVGKNYQ